MVAPALVQLDGVASRLFLASPNLAFADVLALARQSKCDLLLGEDAPPASIGAGFEYRRLPAEPDAGGPSSGGQAARSSTTWLLATSGTTGQPKLVGHRLASLTRTTKLDFERTASVRWGLLYDHARFAGLQVVLQSLLSGAALIAPDLRLELEQQLGHLVEGGCTHLSATPTLWRKLLMSANGLRLPLRQVTLGGEIVDQKVLDALRAAFPQARIVHIYASTEAGVGFSVADGKAGFPLAYLDKPPSGIELRVVSGRLLVRNTAVQSAYVGSGESFADAEGFVDTGDAVELHGQRYYFLGRAGGVINVGGNKVHPEEVERVLLEHPRVAQARVSSRRSSITGALVVAEVVAAGATADSTELRSSILKHCRDRLPRFQVPASIQIVEDLPLNASGKLSRETS